MLNIFLIAHKSGLILNNILNFCIDIDIKLLNTSYQ